MELLDVRKTRPGHAELTIVIAGTPKIYKFSYEDPGIVVAHFPDEFVRMLRLLPVTVAQSLVSRIIKSLETDSDFSPYEIEIEKEILAAV